MEKDLPDKGGDFDEIRFPKNLKTKGMLKGKQKIKGKRYTFSKKTGKLRKKK